MSSSWDENYSILKERQKKHGHCEISFLEDTELLKWAEEQRANKGSLLPSQVEALDRIGFRWGEMMVETTSTATTKKQVQEDAKMPSSNNGSTHSSKKSFSAAQTCTSNREPTNGLKEASSNYTSWDEGYAALLKYKEIYGDCKVPNPDLAENKQLAAWVQAQRDGKINAGDHTLEQRRKLLSIGLSFQENSPKEGNELFQQNLMKQGLDPTEFDRIMASSRDKPKYNEIKTWDEMFQLLQRYKWVHGSCRVVVNNRETLRLSQWVTYQRLRTKTGDLAKDRIEKLKSAGVEFEEMPKKCNNVDAPRQEEELARTSTTTPTKPKKRNANKSQLSSTLTLEEYQGMRAESQLDYHKASFARNDVPGGGQDPTKPDPHKTALTARVPPAAAQRTYSKESDSSRPSIASLQSETVATVDGAKEQQSEKPAAAAPPKNRGGSDAPNRKKTCIAGNSNIPKKSSSVGETKDIDSTSTVTVSESSWSAPSGLVATMETKKRDATPPRERARPKKQRGASESPQSSSGVVPKSPHSTTAPTSSNNNNKLQDKKPAKRGRGRPRKNPADDNATQKKRGRGRPPKKSKALVKDVEPTPALTPPAATPIAPPNVLETTVGDSIRANEELLKALASGSASILPLPSEAATGIPKNDVSVIGKADKAEKVVSPTESPDSDSKKWSQISASMAPPSKDRTGENTNKRDTSPVGELDYDTKKRAAAAPVDTNPSKKKLQKTSSIAYSAVLPALPDSCTLNEKVETPTSIDSRDVPPSDPLMMATNQPNAQISDRTAKAETRGPQQRVLRSRAKKPREGSSRAERIQQIGEPTIGTDEACAVVRSQCQNSPTNSTLEVANKQEVQIQRLGKELARTNKRIQDLSRLNQSNVTKIARMDGERTALYRFITLLLSVIALLLFTSIFFFVISAFKSA